MKISDHAKAEYSAWVEQVVSEAAKEMPHVNFASLQFHYSSYWVAGKSAGEATELLLDTAAFHIARYLAARKPRHES